MAVQKCKKCGKKFNYTQVLDSVGWVYRPLSCNDCGAKHNLKLSYILLITTLLIMPIFFMNKANNLKLHMFLKITISLFYIVYIITVVGLYPFIARYNLKDEKD